VTSPDDANNIPAILDQDKDQEAIDSLNFEEYVDQRFMRTNLHSILQSDSDLPPDPTITYRGPKSILHKVPDLKPCLLILNWSMLTM
jgi:hypothetical protein